MIAFPAEDILCFGCMEHVERCTIDGIDSICCDACGATASHEEAQEDCFVFIVASAMTETLKSHKPHAYRFMPRPAGRDARTVKREMVRLNRASAHARAA